MKINLPLAAALAGGFLAQLAAAPLAVTSAVHSRPDPASPTISVLNAGSDPTPAAAMMGTTPAGWMAVELPGPFEGYIENKDLAKSLDVKPGASIRLAPKPDAGVLAVAEQGDKATITGLRGKWTQISLEKKLVGYIKLGGPAGSPPVAATPPPVAVAPSNAPITAPPVTPAAFGVAAPGQASTAVSVSDPTSSLPRQFVGRFVSTRRPFTPRRPYDYALNDDAGKRYAYLDTSKLALGDQLAKYADHTVVVFGAAKATDGGKDIVIEVQSVQLK